MIRFFRKNFKKVKPFYMLCIYILKLCKRYMGSYDFLNAFIYKSISGKIKE